MVEDPLSQATYDVLPHGSDYTLPSPPIHLTAQALSDVFPQLRPISPPPGIAESRKRRAGMEPQFISSFWRQVLAGDIQPPKRRNPFERSQRTAD